MQFRSPTSESPSKHIFRAQALGKEEARFKQIVSSMCTVYERSAPEGLIANAISLQMLQIGENAALPRTLGHVARQGKAKLVLQGQGLEAYLCFSLHAVKSQFSSL